jgi:hypothetical protein
VFARPLDHLYGNFDNKVEGCSMPEVNEMPFVETAPAS